MKRTIENILKIGFLVLLITGLAGCEQNILLKDVESSIINFDFSDEESGSKLVGGILPIQEEDLRSFLSEIEDNDDKKTIVVIGGTDYVTETSSMFVLNDLDELYNDVNFDKETILSLIESNIVEQITEVGDENGFIDPAIDVIASSFHSAKVVVLMVNNDLIQSRAELLASTLKSYLPEESVVFALSKYISKTEDLPQVIIDFQKDFGSELLKRADFYKFGALPFTSQAPSAVLGLYLQKTSAKNSKIIKTEDGIYALFSKGQSQKTASPTIFLVSFGDIMLGRYVRHLMDVNGMDYPFKDMDNDYLRVNDILIANLEGPVTEKSVRAIEGMNFGFFPDVVPTLKKHHFDIVSLANNHAFDKGKDAFLESFTHLKNGGIIPFGNPNTITEQNVALVIIRGMKIAFIGFEEVNSALSDDDAVSIIKEYAEKGYNVIVYPHWGIEYSHKPTKRQIELGHKFIDAGAYAIIGHHPHVVQTIENYKGHPIIYSLGNSIFDQYWSAPTQEGLSVAMKLTPNMIEINLIPIKLPKSSFRLMSAEEREEFINRFISWADYPADEIEQIKAGKMIFEF